MISVPFRGVLALGAVVLVAAACESDPEAPEIQLPDDDAAALWSYLQDEQYQSSWDLFPGTTEQFEGQAHGSLRTMYMNDTGQTAVESGESIMPPGTIILKEGYAEGDLSGIVAMYKIDGYNPDFNDWFWASYGADGTVNAEGRLDGCQSCHSDAGAENDYIFTPTE